MKKTLLKLTAVALCLTLLLSCAMPSFAADESAAQPEYPIVFVTGIGQTYSYYYNNPDDAKADVAENSTDRADARWNLFCNDFSFAFKEPATYFDILALVGGLVGTAICGRNIVSRKAVDHLINTFFRYNIIDENGKLPDNVVTPFPQCSVKEMTEEQRENFYRTIPCGDFSGSVGEENMYCFCYSPFSFTYDNSENLNKFLNEVVLPQTGAEKVVIVPMSMGASVVSAYLQDHGTDGKIARVISIVGAWYGSEILSDLIEQKYADDAPENIYHGLLAELIGEPWGYLVNSVVRIFPKAALRSVIDEIVDSLVENLIVKTPSLMAVCSMDRYPAIRKMRLEGRPELEYVMKQTDKYYDAQQHLKSTMANLHDNYGVDFYFIAGYGLPFGAITNDYKAFRFLNSAATTNSDEIIQITSTVPGCTSADLGKELPASYIAGKDAAYITPDKSVDLSTAYYPDNVWLFSKQKHELENNNTALRIAFDLAVGKIRSTLDCEDVYPRFNDSRDLKALTRSYIPDLEKWLAENEPTAEQKAKIAEMNAAVAEMTARTINDREADDEIIEAYRQMLIDLGVYEKPAEPKKSEIFFNSIMKKLDDINYRIFGAKGYSDILKK